MIAEGNKIAYRLDAGDEHFFQTNGELVGEVIGVHHETLSGEPINPVHITLATRGSTCYLPYELDRIRYIPEEDYEQEFWKGLITTKKCDTVHSDESSAPIVKEPTQGEDQPLIEF